MKHFNIFFAAALLIMGVSSVNAQDENDPWAVEIGINAVDTFPVGLRDGQTVEDALNGDIFSEYFNVGDHWNILPSVTRLAVSRYVGSNFSVGLAGSLNRIDKLGDVRIDDISYFAVDGEVRYSFRELLGNGWFDPSLSIGGGYNWVGEQEFGAANGGAGVKFWLTEQFAINAMSNYKYAFDDATGIRHLQHSLGVLFKFGGSDTDGDGIYDDVDECPETPGVAEFNGCPDSDGDGIQDKMDDCPDIAGSAEFNGCVDTDGDGVSDNKDNCPSEAGPSENNGCPWPDTDGDGTLDKDDRCPSEAGPKSNRGCPEVDSDGDGILDKDDKCPNEAGTPDRGGCPEPQITTEIIQELNTYSKTILFDLGKSTISQESFGVLQNIKDIMAEYPSAAFVIEGHTDSSGGEATNQRLSDARAAAVKAYLTSAGIDGTRLSSIGYGESRPVASNSTKAGREQNRRVNINLRK